MSKIAETHGTCLPVQAAGRFWRPWHLALAITYFMATVQVAGCYFTLVRPYINTSLYETGRERLPFQTRILMMPLMKWAHRSGLASAAASSLGHSNFWYLRPPEPEAIVQLWINLACLIIAGWATSQIYHAALKAQTSPKGFLGVFLYPLFLVLCVGSYILHTIQNFRFLYDLPSLALFSVGLWLIYFRKPPLLFAALFLLATLNRETSLLLLPFFTLSAAVRDGKFNWKKAFCLKTLTVVAPLAALWLAWHVFIFHLFRHNASEYYPRIALNLYTLAHPRYWPQLLGAGTFLLPFVVLFRRSIADAQLRAWMWALPVWFATMFFWGILVETRVFGELLPYLTCLAILIAEDRIRASVVSQPELELIEGPVLTEVLPQEEAA